jgi:hypothetical protein
MFNTPILDIALGLLFIFLLHSLLATSIKEAIATAFALRARTLRKGIVTGMLSDTPCYGRWKSMVIGFLNTLKEIGYLIIGHRAKEERKLGTLFYNHPIIKNYGSSRIFPHPSYIPNSNFSQVLIDVLQEDFEQKLPSIVHYEYSLHDTIPISQIEETIRKASFSEKLKHLFDYYGSYYNVGLKPIEAVIEKDTWRILLLHYESSMENQVHNMELFAKKLENWFEESMWRVSGWYKRQTQAILFCIGIVMAVVFNIDSIDIAKKLSKDKDLREQMVQMTTSYAESHPTLPSNDTIASATVTFDSVASKFSKAYLMLDKDNEDLSKLLILGWSDFEKEERFCRKVGHVLHSTFSSKQKIIGFLITGFAVSLGAPFWFDLLSKIITIRATGKRENGAH